MASYRKRANGRWNVQVQRPSMEPPFYESRTTTTKAEAVAWATALEADLDAGKAGGIPIKPLSDIITKYRDEVSPGKRGHRWEKNRLNALLADPLAKVLVTDIDSSHTSAWRNRRLKTVSASTVRRDWNLISAMCNTAVNEWKLMRANPFKGVKKPPAPEARDRLIAPGELESLLVGFGYDEKSDLASKTSRVGAALLFAIETGMRVGEICNLVWQRVDTKSRVARLDKTKNGTKRDVALSPRALKILQQLPRDGREVENEKTRKLEQLVFDMDTHTVDALFRKVRDRCVVDDRAIEDLHFHDSRHQAITQLAEKLDILELARMVGIKDLKTLMTYYNKKASAVASKLAGE